MGSFFVVFLKVLYLRSCRDCHHGHCKLLELELQRSKHVNEWDDDQKDRELEMKNDAQTLKVVKDVSDSEDSSDDEKLEMMNNMGFQGNALQIDTFSIIFEEWAKYMLRLDDHRALKDFLNIISGFDLVSSKSEYFVENDNAFTKLMGMMGEFENDGGGGLEDDFMNMNGALAAEQDDNSFMNAWEKVNNFDFQKAATEKWTKLTSFVMGDGEDDDSLDRQNSEQRDKRQQSMSSKIKNSLKGNVSSLTSWWSSSKK